MRHLKRGKRFNRDNEHRRAMFSNMMVAFFQQETLKTTTAKAKELKRLSEKVITRAKENTLHNKRVVLSKLKNRDIVAKLFDEIAPKYKDVNGGYTRIIRLGRRLGDGAELSIVELVDFESKPASRPASRMEKKGKKKESKKEVKKESEKEAKVENSS